MAQRALADIAGNGVDHRLANHWPVAVGLERVTDRPSELSATTDLEAIGAFLQHVHSNKAASTFRAYRKEVLRLAYWCAFVARVSLSDLKHEDLQAYRNFLRDPPKHLCGDQGARGREWRPFSRAGRDEKTVAYAMTIIGALYRYLVDRLYLRRNLVATMPAWTSAPAKEPVRTRRIPRAALDALGDWFDHAEVAAAHGAPDAPGSAMAVVRARSVVAIAFGLALRRSEIARMRYDDMRWDDATNSWSWTGMVKGGRNEKKWMPEHVMNTLAWYRTLQDRPVAIEDALSGFVVTPLSDAGRGVTGQTIADIVQWSCRNTADWLELGHAQARKSSIEALRFASTHWFRHTRASILVEDGVTMSEAAMILGHKSMRTTAEIYAHADQERVTRSSAFQKSPFA